MRLRPGVVLVLGLAGPVGAEPLDCPALAGAVAGLTGLTAPPAGASEHWCILDGARSDGGGLRVTVDRLRVRGEVVQERPTRLQVVAKGLRARPALDDRDMPDWLRDMLRFQTAEVHLILRRDGAGDRVVVDFGQVQLSGGMEAGLLAEIAGADLSPDALLQGRVTRLHLDLKNDGRALRPVMLAFGERLDPSASETGAVLAARDRLRRVVDALPGASLSDEDVEALQGFIKAMPQGRGRLTIEVRSEDGIGAVELGLLALAKDPAGPEALARFLAGTKVSVSWTAGFFP